MPVPTHIKVTYRGVFKGTNETWSFGQHFSRDVGQAPDATLDSVDMTNIKNSAKTFIQNTDARWGNNAQLTDVRAYVIGPDGRMQGNPGFIDCAAENIVGGVTGPYPPQVCWVITHVAANRGPARFGRVFLPTAVSLSTADYKVTPANCALMATAYGTFIKAVSNQIDLAGIASSEGLNVSATQGGVRQAIDHIEVGRVLDTLRSRRRSMTEDRVVGGHLDW